MPTVVEDTELLLGNEPSGRLKIKTKIKIAHFVIVLVLKDHRQPVSFARLCYCYYPGNRIGQFASETRVRRKRDDGRKSFRYHSE